MSNASLRFTISGYIIFIAKAAPLIVIPILVYKFSNWWLLFGILFAYAAISVTYLRTKYLVFSLLLIAFIIYCYLNGFNIQQPVSFFFLCFSTNFILLVVYRMIGFGDKTSRAMIAAMGNRLANEEIEKEIDKGMAMWRAEKKANENIYTDSLVAGKDFQWKHISGFYMCVRSFSQLAEIVGDKVFDPVAKTYGFLYAELPNPDVDQQKRIIKLPIEHKSDYKSIYRANLDKGLKSDINELIVLYEYRRGLFGRLKPCFHVAAFRKGTWQTFFKAVENYATPEFKWPKPLFLFQPSSSIPFPQTKNLFSK
jgi:hypothetical protein